MVGAPVAAEGAAMATHGTMMMFGAGKNLNDQKGRADESSGRGKNNLKPDANAVGDHSSFKIGSDGKITNTATYKSNPKNPRGFDETKRVDVIGKSHKGKSGQEIPTPHVHEKNNTRSANSNELPKKR